MNTTEERLSLRDAADALGVSEVTARRWIKSGKLKAYQPGRKYLIPARALEELLDEADAPKAPAPSPEAEQGRRSPVLNEAVIATVDKWIGIASDPDTNNRKIAGVSEAASALGDSIVDVVENAGGTSAWDALPGREQHEIMSVMEKIAEVHQATAQRLKDGGVKEQVRQRREKIREWTQQISA